jgi:hypothetical protein
MDSPSRHLDQLALQVQAAASGIRTNAAALRATAGSLPWHSPAARSFEAALLGVLSAAGKLAARLDGTASAVRQHSHVIEQRASLLRAAVTEAARASGLHRP